MKTGETNVTSLLSTSQFYSLKRILFQEGTTIIVSAELSWAPSGSIEN